MRTPGHGLFTLSPSACGSSTLDPTAERQLSSSHPSVLEAWTLEGFVSLPFWIKYRKTEKIHSKKKKIQHVNVFQSQIFSRLLEGSQVCIPHTPPSCPSVWPDHVGPTHCGEGTAAGLMLHWPVEMWKGNCTLSLMLALLKPQRHLFYGGTRGRGAW